MAIENQKSQVNEQAIMYQARSVLASLALTIAQTRNLEKQETQNLIQQASLIRYWLKSLDSKLYLSFTQRESIWYKLIEISGIYDFPTSPVLQQNTRPNILLGVQGPIGPQGPSGGNGGTVFINNDVDTGTETCDTFAIGLGSGAAWTYTITKGINQRSGEISGTWLSDGSAVASSGDVSTAELGDTSGVQLSVDINGSNVRLLATVNSDNWIVKGTRILIS